MGGMRARARGCVARSVSGKKLSLPVRREPRKSRSVTRSLRTPEISIRRE